MNKIYKIHRDEICCSQEFIDIKINNYFGLTTEQVKKRPLLDMRNEQCSKVVGHLEDADEEYIYGIVYNPSILYDDRKENFSIEVLDE